jgi:WD40 repeat protein
MSPDGSTLATASWDGSVALWDLGGSLERSVLRSPAGRIQGVALLGNPR